MRKIWLALLAVLMFSAVPAIAQQTAVQVVPDSVSPVRSDTSAIILIIDNSNDTTFALVLIMNGIVQARVGTVLPCNRGVYVVHSDRIHGITKFIVALSADDVLVPVSKEIQRKAGAISVARSGIAFENLPHCPAPPEQSNS